MAAMSISTHNTKFWRSAAFSAFLMNRDLAARKTRTPCLQKKRQLELLHGYFVLHKSMLQTETTSHLNEPTDLNKGMKGLLVVLCLPANT
jgi:hypothetical protein